MTELSVSVVLCAYSAERWDDLSAAVASIRAQSTPAFETLLVIDHNNDLLRRAKAEMPDITVLPNATSRGAGGARNTGVAAASGALIAFLDDDARAVPSWLQEITRPHADPSTLGVGGTIVPLWSSQRPEWFPAEFDWVVGCTYPGLPTATAPVRNLIAANMSVRRDAFLELGGFREGFGKSGARSGTEETELCIRALQRWPDRYWVHHPPVTVWHRVPESRATFRYFLGRCYDEGVAKATIVEIAGRQDGLAAEERYVRKVLPRGVARGIAEAARDRRIAGLQRSATIVTGLAVTGVGFLLGRLRARLAHRKS